MARGPFLRSVGMISAITGFSLWALLLSSQHAGAQGAAPQVTVELNKLEPQEKGCRAYLVVNNDSTAALQSYKLDLVLFQPDGVIGRRFVIDLAPLKPGKRSVKLFDLDGVGCDKVGSLLVNDIVECKAEGGAIADCLAGMTVKYLTSVQLSK